MMYNPARGKLNSAVRFGLIVLFVNVVSTLRPDHRCGGFVVASCRVAIERPQGEATDDSSDIEPGDKTWREGDSPIFLPDHPADGARREIGTVPGGFVPRPMNFFDDFFTRQLESLHIPGAVVVWVVDGRVSFASGYGVADRDTLTPVDPAKTVFRVASVAKVFTALAALQLAQDGKLDLDADVNEYLGSLRVGRSEFGAVTSRRLLTHTAGFDERLVGYLTHDAREIADLGGYLKAWMPPQTRPAGAVASYSNHGYALLGYLVERASGAPFHVYAHERIFAPLQMDRTAFLVSPLTPAARSELARGYWSSGAPTEEVWSRPYPAGALATTAHDMGQFLIALLSALHGKPSVTLPPYVVEQMTTKQFSHRQDLPGYTLGLTEMNVNGERVLLKGGSAPGHTAVMAIFPDRDAGLFVAANRQEPELWTSLIARVCEQRRLASAEQPARALLDGDRVGRFAGEYRLLRYARASFERILSLAVHARVQAADGGLRVTGPGLDVRFLPGPAPLLFVSDSGQYLAFREGGNGRVDEMYMNVAGDHFAFERVAPWERTTPTIVALLTASVVVVFAAAAQVAAGISRRVRGGALRASKPIVPAWISVGLAWAIVAAFALAYLSATPSTRFLYSPSPALWGALTSTNLTAVFGVLMVVTAGRRLFERHRRLPSRVASLALCASAAIILAFLATFNLIGYRL